MILVMRRVDYAGLAMLRSDPDRVFEYVVEDQIAQESGDIIDFDKAWHALHFLLTGTGGRADAPLSLFRTDSESIGDDLGYGPAEVVPAAQMREFHKALASMTDETLRSRYDPVAIAAADVYIGDTFLEDGDEGWDYIAQSIPALRASAERCAATGS